MVGTYVILSLLRHILSDTSKICSISLGQLLKHNVFQIKTKFSTIQSAGVNHAVEAVVVGKGWGVVREGDMHTLLYFRFYQVK
jgi:hypothetical protein